VRNTFITPPLVVYTLVRSGGVTLYRGRNGEENGLSSVRREAAGLQTGALSASRDLRAQGHEVQSRCSEGCRRPDGQKSPPRLEGSAVERISLDAGSRSGYPGGAAGLEPTTGASLKSFCGVSHPFAVRRGVIARHISLPSGYIGWLSSTPRRQGGTDSRMGLDSVAQEGLNSRAPRSRRGTRRSRSMRPQSNQGRSPVSPDQT
jgi:hypothetical protein